MKKFALFISIVIGLASFSSCTTTYAVRERPREVVYVRPAAPSRDHIWVSGDWRWNGGRYEWREGHWDRPRHGAAWRDGHWQQSRRGWKWIPGHWQRF